MKTDICVIGGGAAGISFATTFCDTSTQVVLLEGGTLVPEVDSRNIYRVVPGTRPILDVDPSRSWHFGGNTNHWFGNCRPLDTADFAHRDWIPYSGWPISRHELLPYYERAQQVAGLGDFGWYDLDACRLHLEHLPLDIDEAVLETRVLQTCPVPSFAELHHRRLEASSNVRILLRTQALRLKMDGRGDRVGAVEAVDLDGNRLHIEAEVFVLAAGGVENARLLLCSDEPNHNGLGNDHDLVGRFFMEHWCFDIRLGAWKSGDLELYHGLPAGGVGTVGAGGLQAVGDARVWAQLALSEELMQDERLPGLSMWFPLVVTDALSVQATRRLAKSVIARRRSEQPLTDVRLFLTDPVEVSMHVLRKFHRGGEEPRAGCSLRVQLEQTPDPENRIRLSSTRDRFGRPLAELELRLSAAARQDHIRSVGVAADAVGLDGKHIARQIRLMLDTGLFDFLWHHLGTTRMDDDPTRGVVDANCQVHGTANLFVAGCSVFPTGGTAAPTLTIVALALRLADFIQGKLAPSSSQ